MTETLAAQLEANREALRAFEGSALAQVAESLMRVCEVQTEILEGLEGMRREEWMTPEQAAAYLGGRTRKSFERIAPHLPRSYVSRQDILYSRTALDEALRSATSPEASIVNYRHDDNSGRVDTERRDTGAARSLTNALKNG